MTRDEMATKEEKTREAVQEIRRSPDSSEVLADRFGCPREVVDGIRSGESWQELPWPGDVPRSATKRARYNRKRCGRPGR